MTKKVIHPWTDRDKRSLSYERLSCAVIALPGAVIIYKIMLNRQTLNTFNST